MSISRALMAYLERLPKKKAEEMPATTVADKPQSQLERLEAFIIWRAEREKSSISMTPEHPQVDDVGTVNPYSEISSVEDSVLQFMIMREQKA